MAFTVFFQYRAYTKNYNITVAKLCALIHEKYPMVNQVANSAGDVQKLPVTVEIYDPSKEAQKPQFEL